MAGEVQDWLGYEQETTMADIALKPCPFCGSKNIDPEGWASTERSGPACDDCAGSADTVELWNSRPVEAGKEALLNELRERLADRDRRPYQR